MGEFLQIRIAPPGSGLDDTCAMILDDGRPVTLAPESRHELVGQVLNLDLLAKYWHPEKPGRDPLRVVENEVVSDAPSFKMFGSPVLYASKAELQSAKHAYFELTKLEATATRVRIDFEYEVEGVRGYVEWRKPTDDWRITDNSVVQR